VGLSKRKRLIVAGALLLLVGAFLAFLFWPRPDELARWKARMRARGERFSLAEVAPKFSQEKLDWAKQLQPVIGGVFSQPVPPGGVDLMVSVAPGYAVPAWQRPFAYETAKTNHTWEALAEQMDKSADAFHQLHELLRNIPVGSPTDYSDPVNIGSGINLVAIRKAAQSLSLATLNELHRGALDAALTNLHVLIALTRPQEEAGSLVDQMIRVAIAGLGAAATWEALQAPGWDDAQLAALDAAWARVELVKRMALTFEIERAWGSEIYQYARTNQGGLSPIFGGRSGGAARAFKDKVYTPLWQKAWSKQDELLYQRSMQPIGEGIRDAVTNRSWQRLRAGLETAGDVALTNLTTLDQFRYQFSASAIPNWSKALKSLLRLESQIHMARAAIAIERHRLKHGRAPESLATLVPEFLREMPVDYMTGRPLLFALNSDGSFALYSAGEDGRDDDGLGDDVVWPQASLPTRVTAPQSGERIPALTFHDASPREVIEKLARQAGLEVRYQPKAAEKLPAKFSFTLNNVTAAEALDATLQRLNLALVRGPKHTNHCVVVNPFARKEH
jgi:hypothetical protein